MPKTLVALYATARPARAALERLVEETDVSPDAVSIVAHEGDPALAGFARDRHQAGRGAGAGAATGAVIGGVGGLLAGLGVFAIPTVGSVAAAGPLTGALVGAGAGAATGGLIGALVGVGIPEAEAERYAEGVRRGGALLVVQCTAAQRPAVERALEACGPLDIERLAPRQPRAGPPETSEVDAARPTRAKAPRAPRVRPDELTDTVVTRRRPARRRVD